MIRLCSPENDTAYGENYCQVRCTENIESEDADLTASVTFWSFLILMSIGTIGFNVTNSISDAICFDVIGKSFYLKCHVGLVCLCL